MAASSEDIEPLTEVTCSQDRMDTSTIDTDLTIDSSFLLVCVYAYVAVDLWCLFMLHPK